MFEAAIRGFIALALLGLAAMYILHNYPNLKRGYNTAIMESTKGTLMIALTVLVITTGIVEALNKGFLRDLFGAVIP